MLHSGKLYQHFLPRTKIKTGYTCKYVAAKLNSKNFNSKRNNILPCIASRDYHSVVDKMKSFKLSLNVSTFSEIFWVRGFLCTDSEKCYSNHDFYNGFLAY